MIAKAVTPPATRSTTTTALAIVIGRRHQGRFWGDGWGGESGLVIGDLSGKQFH